MPEFRALFWDVGGVLATNGWDREQRRQLAAEFSLDYDDLEARHEQVVSALETDRMSLDEYLDSTVFYKPRPFSREQFKQTIFALSQPKPELLMLAHELADSGQYLMATINNESRELNAYRIEKFGLREIFDVFFSSCYLGLRKPDERLYRAATDITQILPEQCCFIDDRLLNLEHARHCGIETIQFRDVQQLRRELHQLGIEAVLPAATRG